MGELKALLAWVEALEREQSLHKAGLEDTGGTSSAPLQEIHKEREGEKLKQILSSKLTAIEKATGDVQSAPAATTVIQDGAPGEVADSQAPANSSGGSQVLAGEQLSTPTTAGDTAQWAS